MTEVEQFLELVKQVNESAQRLASNPNPPPAPDLAARIAALEKVVFGLRSNRITPLETVVFGTEWVPPPALEEP